MTVMIPWVGTLCLLMGGFLFFESRRLSERIRNADPPYDQQEKLMLERRSNRMFMLGFGLFLSGASLKILNSYPRVFESLKRFLDNG